MPINKKGDDRRAILKYAQQALGKVMLGKEDAAAGKKRKQAVMYKLLTPCAKTPAESSPQKLQDLKNGICFFSKFCSRHRGEYEVCQSKSASKLQGTSLTQIFRELLDNANESSEKLVAPILVALRCCSEMCSL